MCVNIEVILPTLERFLLLYSLRCGSILTLFWTLLRSLFCVIFFSSAILEVMIGIESPFGGWLAMNKQEIELPYVVYYALIVLLLCDTIIFVFMIHLAVGLFRYRTHFLEHYLLCRFLIWLFEVIGLLVLCLAHKQLIGWYLGIVFFVGCNTTFLITAFLIADVFILNFILVLESYSFIVVYSYYVQLMTEEKEC